MEAHAIGRDRPIKSSATPLSLIQRTISRSRLRKAIAVVSLDGSLDSEESLDNNIVDEDDIISCESVPAGSCSDANLDRKV